MLSGLRQWIGRLFPADGIYRGKVSFKGDLGIKVIRANPPGRKQRAIDALNQMLGRYST